MNKWTETEDQTLSDTSLSYDQLQALLPGRTRKGIWSRAAKLGFKRDTALISRVNSENQRKASWTEPLDNKKFCAIVDGELLGDGCVYRKLVKNRLCYEYAFIAGSVHLEYAKYLHDKIRSSINSKASIRSKQKYGEKKFHSVRFSNVIFSNFYRRWYTKGTHKTEVPKDLVLSPTACLHWYLGDGSLDSSPRRHMYEITLHTECFDFDSVEYLQYQLSKAADIKVNFRKSKQRRALRIHGDDARQFLNYIGKCPIQSMQYKWRDWK